MRDWPFVMLQIKSALDNRRKTGQRFAGSLAFLPLELEFQVAMRARMSVLRRHHLAGTSCPPETFQTFPDTVSLVFPRFPGAGPVHKTPDPPGGHAMLTAAGAVKDAKQAHVCRPGP